MSSEWGMEADVPDYSGKMAREQKVKALHGGLRLLDLIQKVLRQRNSKF